MKVNRKIIKIDEELCDGCGQCIIACAEGALEIIDGKAKVIGFGSHDSRAYGILELTPAYPERPGSRT